MSQLYVLYEHASGYALFRIKEYEEIGAFIAHVEQSSTDLSKFNSVVKLIAFTPFTSGLAALDNLNAISEGMSPILGQWEILENLTNLWLTTQRYNPRWFEIVLGYELAKAIRQKRQDPIGRFWSKNRIVNKRSSKYAMHAHWCHTRDSQGYFFFK